MSIPYYDAKALLDPKSRHSKAAAPKDKQSVANPYDSDGSLFDNSQSQASRRGHGSMYEKIHNVEQRQDERTIKRQKTSHASDQENQDGADDAGHKKKKPDAGTGRSGGDLGTYMKEKREEAAKNNPNSSVVDLTGGKPCRGKLLIVMD